MVLERSVLNLVNLVFGLTWRVQQDAVLGCTSTKKQNVLRFG